MRRANLSPAISPLKYDLDEICEARALVRSGFQAEIADKEPVDRRVSSYIHVCVGREILLRFRSPELISLAKCAAKDIPSSVSSLEEAT